MEMENRGIVINKENAVTPNKIFVLEEIITITIPPRMASPKDARNKILIIREISLNPPMARKPAMAITMAIINPTIATATMRGLKSDCHAKKNITTWVMMSSVISRDGKSVLSIKKVSSFPGLKVSLRATGNIVR
jgi:hypothetical protein